MLSSLEQLDVGGLEPAAAEGFQLLGGPVLGSALIAVVALLVALASRRARRRERRALQAALGVAADGPVLVRAVERQARALRRADHERRRLAELVDGLGCAVVTVDGARRVTWLNSAARSLLGVEGERIAGAELTQLLGEDAELLDELLRRLFDDALVPRVVESEFVTRDARRVPVLVSASRLGEDGRGGALIAIETGDLKRIEERLHRSNMQLWLLNELTAIALRVRDLEPAVDQMAIALRESSCFRAAGLAVLDPRDATLRFSCLAGFGDVETSRARALAGSFLGTVLRHREPILLHAPDGRLEFDDVLLDSVDAQVFGAFPLVVDDRAIGLLMLAASNVMGSVEDFGHSGSDLSRHLAPLLDLKLTNEELRRSNQELEASRASAEDASRAKSDFLANMSHEIRTPMTAILGYADLVREGGLTPDTVGEFVSTIRRNGEHLLAIINDILDISKIEAGRMGVELVDCSPIDVVLEIVDMMRGRADEKGVSLGVDFAWPLPRGVRSDPTRLRQILANLVGNAIKFTQAGGVHVCLRYAADADEPPELRFEVIDSGIGLSAVELTRIFKPFSQADSSHARRFGGTGLGLAISQRLARLLGGSISVQSRKGFGSTFTLRLPAEVSSGEAGGMLLRYEDFAAETAARARERQEQLPRIDARVLLAEDGPDNQRLVSFLLKRAGATVDIAADGREAIAAVLAAIQEGAPFDVVLMDMQMPVLDGYAATATLRAHGYTRPILALTAHAMAGDRQKCLDAGCDGFLTKPIDRRELIRTVAACTVRASESGDARQAPARPGALVARPDGGGVTTDE
ncbi:MAG: response regulator [Planctomycetes bacterium]|nr:response regulator [Planctomycetota bacterium]